MMAGIYMSESSHELIFWALEVHSTSYTILWPSLCSVFFSAAQLGGVDSVIICENLECNLKMSWKVCCNNLFLDSTFPDKGRKKNTLILWLLHSPLCKLPFLSLSLLDNSIFDSHLLSLILCQKEQQLFFQLILTAF